MSKTTPIPRFLTEAEAAKLLGMSAQQLATYRRDPQSPTPPHVHFSNRAVRYEKAQLLDWFTATAAAAARA